MRKTAQPGFALLLVLILVAMGVVLSLSYLSAASMQAQVSKTYQQAARARYLAESGLEHGLYLMRFAPPPAGQGWSAPRGPFTVEGAPGVYYVSCRPDGTTNGRYILSATGIVGGQTVGTSVVGGTRRTSEVSLYRTAAKRSQVKHGVYVRSGILWVPPAMTVNGDAYINGWAVAFGPVNGNVSATAWVLDPWQMISGQAQSFAAPIDLPNILLNQYTSYRLEGVNCAAPVVTKTELDSTDGTLRDGAVGPTNLGGVVYLNPTSGDTVTLRGNINFTGTLAVKGNLLIQGNDITLTALDGFPAVLATGSVRIVNDSRRVTINGVVVAERGLDVAGNTANSSVTFNGGLVSQYNGLVATLAGQHTLNYRKDLANLYDFSIPDPQRKPQVTALSYRD